MKNFQQRMYEQGFILSDYEKGKPFCDEIDRLTKLLLDDLQKLTISQIQNITRKLHETRKEALANFQRNPLGHPKANSSNFPQGVFESATRSTK